MRYQRRWSIAAGFMTWFIAALFLLPFMVQAQEATNYDYSTTITFTAGTSVADADVLLVRATINTDALIEQSRLAADGQDILALDGGTELPPFAEVSATQSSATWWFPLRNVSAGGSESITLYTGQNTTTADNPQRLTVQESPNDQLTDADNAAWENNTISIFARSLTLDAFPTTEGWIIYKDGSTAWEAGINSSGAPYLQINCSAGACAPSSPITITGSALTVGTTYNVAWTAQVGSSSGDDGIWVDGVLDVAWTAVGTMATNATGVIGLASIAADVEQLRFYDGTIYNHSTPGACTVATTCWNFEPDGVVQTQEGTPANAWHWLGTIDNTGTAGATTDATYTFVRDMSDWTVSKGPVTSTILYVASSSSAETFGTFVSGAATDPFGNSFNTSGSTYSWPLSIFDNFVGDNSQNQMPDFLFSSIVLLVVTFVTAVGTFSGTRIIGMAVILAMLAGSMIVLMTPLPAALILFMAVGALVSLRVIPEPMTAR